MTESLRAILVNPFDKLIVELVNLTHQGLHEVMEKEVGDDRAIYTLAPPGQMPGVQFAIHDWAIMQPEQRFFRIEHYPHPLGGKVLFFGYNREGETVSLPEMMREWFEQKVIWCPDTMRFLRFEDHEELVDSPYSPGKKARQVTRKAIYQGDVE